VGGGTVDSVEEKKTIALRLHFDTHERLRRAKHEMRKDTFDEAVTALLDEHDARKKARKASQRS